MSDTNLPASYKPTPSSQLVTFILMVVIGYLAAALLLSSMVSLFPNAIDADGNIANYSFMRTAQIMQFAMMMFAPTMAYLSFFADDEDKKVFGACPSESVYFYAFALFLASTPFVDYLATVNKNVQLPQWLSDMQNWMQKGEVQAQTLLSSMLNTTQPTTIALNFAIMAVLPAICEEFLFRGVLQTKLTQIWQKPWLAIFATAAIFSALHFQFLTFLPRLVQGMALGYLFYATGSIWVAVTAHFTNNALSLAIYYYIKAGNPNVDPLAVNTESHTAGIVLLSVTLSAIALWLVHQKTQELKRG